MNKILKNISWLVFDKIFILILQFFIGVKVANYYGSETYGAYNYVVAIVSFSSIFFELMNSRVIKKYYNEENYNDVVFNTTLFRNSLAIILFLLSISLKTFINIDKMSYFILVFLAMDNIFVTATMGIENYFEYKLDTKKIVISNNIVKILSYSLQYVGILLNYSIVMVPIIRCFGSLIRMILLKYLYKKDYKAKKRSSINKSLINSIIRESFYLWASFIAFLLYTQLDKIMLGFMLGKKEVGIYSIGTQLSQILAIIIVPIQTCLFPQMLSLYRKNYEEYINFYLKMNYFITQGYILISILSVIIVRLVFPYIFSEEYIQAIYIYQILIIAVFMRANGALQTSHMTLKEITKKSFYKTVFGVIINSILNYFLIKKYGVIGAAIATSVTQIFTLFIIDFFIEEYREQAIIQLKSLNLLLILNKKMRR